MLRGCFHVACYTVHGAKDRATAPVGAAKPNARIIDNGYLEMDGFSSGSGRYGVQEGCRSKVLLLSDLNFIVFNLGPY
jgi:hypothetical protein